MTKPSSPNGRGFSTIAPKTTYTWILKIRDILFRELHCGSFPLVEETQLPGDVKRPNSRRGANGQARPHTRPVGPLHSFSEAGSALRNTRLPFRGSRAPGVTEHTRKARSLFLFAGVVSVPFGDPKTNVFM